MRVHGSFLAGEVGELAGVSGNTIGQWARWGYIHASRSDGVPHVYALEDVVEAGVVSALLARGVKHAQVRQAISRLTGPWPLSHARLAVTPEGRIALRADGGVYALSPRGWQLMAAPPPLEDVRAAAVGRPH